MGHIRPARLWPSRTIPYEISRTISGHSTRMDSVQDAISDWNTLTVIKLQPIEDLLRNRNWLRSVARRGNPLTTSRVKFIISSLQRGCNSSYVGMKGGRQFIRCFITSFSKGRLLHEIGHALGLKHEHQRVDRNQFVNVDATGAPNPGDYRMFRPPWYVPVGGYDCISIMHYSQNAFISPQSGGCGSIGASSLSVQDINTINAFYGAKQLF